MGVVEYTAPREYYPLTGYTSIFLAGGITDCEDWQREVVKKFFSSDSHKVAALNPRRPNFPMDDPNAADEQIAWEFRHLSKADVILFWFPKSQSPQPIAQYELGRYVALGKRVAVGCHPEYSRAIDVHTQMRLANPLLKVHNTLRGVFTAAKYA